MDSSASFRSYLFVFLFSAALTLAAYFMVAERLLAGPYLIAAVSLLGVVQAAVQLIVFLNLGREGTPHWNTLVFAFMLAILVIIVAGSLWIMYNLDYRMMTTEDEVEMLHNQPGL